MKPARQAKPPRCCVTITSTAVLGYLPGQTVGFEPDADGIKRAAILVYGHHARPANDHSAELMRTALGNLAGSAVTAEQMAAIRQGAPIPPTPAATANPGAVQPHELANRLPLPPARRGVAPRREPAPPPPPEEPFADDGADDDAPPQPDELGGAGWAVEEVDGVTAVAGRKLRAVGLGELDDLHSATKSALKGAGLTPRQVAAVQAWQRDQ
jgi:hypothetical protein